MPCPEKPEGKKTIYHETTKIRKHEKEHKNFRVFVGTFIYHKNTNLNVKELTCLSSI